MADGWIAFQYLEIVRMRLASLGDHCRPDSIGFLEADPMFEPGLNPLLRLYRPHGSSADVWLIYEDLNEESFVAAFHSARSKRSGDSFGRFTTASIRDMRVFLGQLISGGWEIDPSPFGGRGVV